MPYRLLHGRNAREEVNPALTVGASFLHHFDKNRPGSPIPVDYQ
jgi:hypothetical protein